MSVFADKWTATLPRKPWAAADRQTSISKLFVRFSSPQPTVLLEGQISIRLSNYERQSTSFPRTGWPNPGPPDRRTNGVALELPES